MKIARGIREEIITVIQSESPRFERPEIKTTTPPHLRSGYISPIGGEREGALGIDPGIDNWLTCVSTLGDSFIIDGKKVKSLNQNYNRRVSSLKEGKPQDYWNFELARITEKRNRQIRDAVNKAAQMVINYCLSKNIGTIVFGWNKGQRQGINIGTKNNRCDPGEVSSPRERAQEKLCPDSHS